MAKPRTSLKSNLSGAYRFCALIICAVLFFIQPAFAATVDDSQAYMVKGENAAAEGDWTNALNEFLLAVGANDHNATAVYQVGIAYFHLGRLPKAQIAEQLAIQIDAKLMPAYLELATIHSRQGHFAEARQVISNALKIWTDDEKLNRTLAEVGRAESLAAVQTAAESKAAIRGAAPLAVSPFAKSALLYSQKDTSGLFRESDAALQQGDLQRAKHALQFALKLEPADPETHWRLCNVLESEGSTAAAVAEAQQSVNLDPENTKWYLALGWALSRSGKWSESYQAFKDAYNRNNELQDAIVGQCYALAKQKQFMLARITLHVSDPAARDTSWFHEATGLILEEKGDVVGAYRECTRASEIAPNDYQIKYTLSRVAYQLACSNKNAKDSWRQAARHAKELLAYSPCDVEVLINLGVCLQHSGDTEGALKTLARATEISPSNAAAHGAYASALYAAGQTDQAREHARIAKKLDPNQKLAENVLIQLNAALPQNRSE